jgi:hypothetical protein
VASPFREQRDDNQPSWREYGRPLSPVKAGRWPPPSAAKGYNAPVLKEATALLARMSGSSWFDSYTEDPPRAARSEIKPTIELEWIVRPLRKYRHCLHLSRYNWSRAEFARPWRSQGVAV